MALVIVDQKDRTDEVHFASSPGGEKPTRKAIRQARELYIPDEMKMLQEEWSCRKKRLGELKAKRAASRGKQLSDEETEERKRLWQTTSHQRNPTYCAEPELFLPMRKHSKRNDTKKLSVHALSLQLEDGKIRIMKFCGNYVYAKNAIQANWKEIVDLGAGRGGSFVSMPKAIAIQ
jgi:hypothetical protein